MNELEVVAPERATYDSSCMASAVDEPGRRRRVRAVWAALALIAVAAALFGLFALLHDVAPHWADSRITDPGQRAADVGRVRTAILAVLAGVVASASAIVAALSLRHAGRVHRATQTNEAARRAAELYATAGTQLGSDSAPVRLAGVYTFERLAQQEPQLRRTVVDVWCSYLRIPFPPVEDETRRHGEREVRLAIQRLVENHLRPGTDHWHDIALNLRGAELVTLNLSEADVGGPVDLRDARIVDGATMEGATFRTTVRAGGAHFYGNVSLRKATFEHTADFANTYFTACLQATDAHFLRDVSFKGARIEDDALFVDATFAAGAIFADGTFAGVGFHNARFQGEVRHQVLTIGGDGTSSGPESRGGPIFSGATFTELSLRHAEMSPTAIFTGAKASRLTRVSGAVEAAGDSTLDIASSKPLE